MKYRVHLKNQQDIIEALVGDDLNDIEQHNAVVQQTNFDSEIDDDEETTTRQPVPPRHSVLKGQDQLNETAVNSRVYDTIVHSKALGMLSEKRFDKMLRVQPDTF